jgi:hypothetical protein
MKKAVIAVILLFSAAIARAGVQAPASPKGKLTIPRGAATTAPYVGWTWGAPTSGSVPASYNLWQANGACTATGLAYVKIASVTAMTWNQTTLPATITCTYVTGVSAVGVEGPPSPTFQLDLTPPGAPTAPQGTYYP